MHLEIGSDEWKKQAVRQDTVVTGDVFPHLQDYLWPPLQNSPDLILRQADIWQAMSAFAQLTNYQASIDLVRRLRRRANMAIAVYGERHVNVDIVPFLRMLLALFDAAEQIVDLDLWLEAYYLHAGVGNEALDEDSKERLLERQSDTARQLELLILEVKGMIMRLSPYGVLQLENPDDVEGYYQLELRRRHPWYMDPDVRPRTP